MISPSASQKVLCWRSGHNHAIRKGDYKLVKNRGKEGLFALSSDISETADLSSEKPDVRRELEETFAEWNSQMIEPLWTVRRAARTKAAQVGLRASATKHR